ncbi:hypothetical protein OG389_20235 [Streptomyces sp. NBC_00435]|uniref:hypothetical protein n=1 Tax=Streptomyces sp. NBC_00435 TaxID=2903649 RepID=UPI002E1FBBD7
MATRRGFIGGVSTISAVTLLGTSTAASAVEVTDPATDGIVAASPEAELAARDAIRAVNAGMRSNYAALKSELITHLSPVIVVQNDAKGGKFTLIDNGVVQEAVNPVAEIFELAKSISHVPLGIFSIIAPYLSNRVPNLPNAGRVDPHDLRMVASKGPLSDGWITPLQGFATTLTTARQQLNRANLPQDLRISFAKVIDEALTFIADSVRGRSFDMASFETFSARVYPSIRTNMTYAANAQITAIEGLMQRWRTRIGEAAWADLYTVVLSIWTTSELNQASIIIKRCMNPAKVATHLIDLPTVQLPTDPIFVALDNLARIVQDNIAAEMVFPTDQKVADALKGKEDLLSDEILKQLGVTTGVRTASAASAVATCPVQRTTAAV